MGIVTLAFFAAKVLKKLELLTQPSTPNFLVLSGPLSEGSLGLQPGEWSTFAQRDLFGDHYGLFNNQTHQMYFVYSFMGRCYMGRPGY